MSSNTTPNANTSNNTDDPINRILGLLEQQQQLFRKPTVTFNSFQDVKPPEFHGTSDPVVAQSWLREIEKGFSLIKVEEQQKVEFASYYLKNEANYWWESRKAMEGSGIVSWERFTELFLDKYFPRAMQNKMELEFLELKQNDLSVSDYERRFTELARFVPEYVDTEVKRVKRFQHGLKPGIRSKIALFELKTYSEIVQKTLLAENEKNLKEKESGKKKDESQNVGHNRRSNNRLARSAESFKRSTDKRHNQAQSVNQSGRSGITVAKCETCGKEHRGVCHKNITCSRCKRKGHHVRDCRDQKDAITCYKCRKTGHVSKDCRSISTI